MFDTTISKQIQITNVNTTWAFLQTTGGKHEPQIALVVYHLNQVYVLLEAYVDFKSEKKVWLIPHTSVVSRTRKAMKDGQQNGEKKSENRRNNGIQNYTEKLRLRNVNTTKTSGA